jgi:hypothetical protein
VVRPALVDAVPHPDRVHNPLALGGTRITSVFSDQYSVTRPPVSLRKVP